MCVERSDSGRFSKGERLFAADGGSGVSGLAERYVWWWGKLSWPDNRLTNARYPRRKVKADVGTFSALATLGLEGLWRLYKRMWAESKG
jgi:hypothetical protein